MADTTNETSQGEQKIVVYATSWCPDCHFAKRWLDSHGVAYDYVDIEQNDEAAAYVVKLNNGRQSVPTIVFPDNSILVEPDARALSAKFPNLVK
ncbi:glutaredoxin family protein [Dictyobacter arantiisoli]|uniref:NrdH-redoxin n=1 Tax=Dictyobacter arantiisoli TaxID=2014874 RepID=A0A5A5TDY2_9CHLR|nr:glutaredoxin family protein [Dictyobacter arantiisoli]GCF09750.1 NrdH-redoxin [Dictyobacter arantiisoli]